MPSNICKTAKRTASTAAILKLPDESALKRQLHRSRKLENPTPPVPSCLADLVLGEAMLLHENKDEEKRNLDRLQRCTSWYVDATFKPSLQLF